MKSVIMGGLLGILVAGSAWAGGYGHGYGHYGYGSRYHSDSDVGLALLGGLLFGGLIGYAINEDRHRARAYYPDPYYYHPHPPAHRPAAVYVPAPVYVPRAAPAAGYRPRDEFGAECVMTREYTTTVYFDGREHEAYGTRCMQADGSWLLGAPKLAPQ